MLTDGSGPYFNNMTCQWLVTAPAGYRVVVVITRLFATTGDFLYLNDGPTATDPQILKQGGNPTTFALYYSTGVSMLVRWISDASVSGTEGFQAWAYFIPTGTQWDTCGVSTTNCMRCTTRWTEQRASLGITGSPDSNALIPYPGGWAPNTATTSAYVMVDFGSPKWLTEVATQGKFFFVFFFFFPLCFEFGCACIASLRSLFLIKSLCLSRSHTRTRTHTHVHTRTHTRTHNAHTYTHTLSFSRSPLLTLICTCFLDVIHNSHNSQNTCTHVHTYNSTGVQDRAFWTITYQLQYSLDGSTYRIYSENGTNILFNGNYDQQTVVYNYLREPVVARYVRLYPQTWNTRPGFRFQFSGYNESKQRV